MELWDVYTRDRIKTGQLHKRGEPMKRGDFHLVVHVWIRNSSNKFLIQKRADTVEICPGLWAITGGSAITGDDTVAALIRETKEELGIDVQMDKSRLIYTLFKHNSIADIWLLDMDINDSEIALQKEEVSAYRWATSEEIMQMASKRSFVNYEYLSRFFAAVKRLEYIN